MGRRLQFTVNICLGYGDGGEIAVNVEVTDEEYELLKQCCRENETVESFNGLEKMYERIVAEAGDESEFNDSEDCDIDYDEAYYSVEIPFEIYEEVENEQTEEE